MKDGLMGEFAKSKIDIAIKYLNQKTLTQEQLDYCENIISIYGYMTSVEDQMSKMLEETEAEIQAPALPRQRYQSSKGEADRRKITAKTNLAKAREAKAAKKKQKTEECSNNNGCDFHSI